MSAGGMSAGGMSAGGMSTGESGSSNGGMSVGGGGAGGAGNSGVAGSTSVPTMPASGQSNNDSSCALRGGQPPPRSSWPLSLLGLLLARRRRTARDKVHLR
jgi:MYXO-CTERM domain-containing protein